MFGFVLTCTQHASTGLCVARVLDLAARRAALPLLAMYPLATAPTRKPCSSDSSAVVRTSRSHSEAARPLAPSPARDPFASPILPYAPLRTCHLHTFPTQAAQRGRPTAPIAVAPKPSLSAEMHLSRIHPLQLEIAMSSCNSFLGTAFAVSPRGVFFRLWTCIRLPWRPVPKCGKRRQVAADDLSNTSGTHTNTESTQAVLRQ